MAAPAEDLSVTAVPDEEDPSVTATRERCDAIYRVATEQFKNIVVAGGTKVYFCEDTFVVTTAHFSNKKLSVVIQTTCWQTDLFRWMHHHRPHAEIVINVKDALYRVWGVDDWRSLESAIEEIPKSYNGVNPKATTEERVAVLNAMCDALTDLHALMIPCARVATQTEPPEKIVPLPATMTLLSNIENAYNTYHPSQVNMIHFDVSPRRYYDMHCEGKAETGFQVYRAELKKKSSFS